VLPRQPSITHLIFFQLVLADAVLKVQFLEEKDDSSSSQHKNHGAWNHDKDVGVRIGLPSCLLTQRCSVLQLWFVVSELVAARVVSPARPENATRVTNG